MDQMSLRRLLQRLPLNAFGTDTGLGGEFRGNYCVLDPKSADGGTVSKGGRFYIGPGD